MKYFRIEFWVVLITFFILPVAGMAQTVYVTEKFEITMRTGPATDRKIILLVNSGTPLQLLEKGGEWSKVRESGSGKEGWVLNRYLTPSRPCSMGFERLQRDYEAMMASHNKLKEDFKQLNDQKKTGDADLSKERQEKDDIRARYETLQRDCAEYTRLKQNHAALLEELEAEKTRSAKLDEENMQMKRDTIIQWVLTGGGIMLVGFIMGLFSANRRKPRSSLY